MEYKIRKAKISDAYGIANVHIKSWKETYTRIVDDEYLKGLSIEERFEKWKEWLKPSKSSWKFVAISSDKKIIGFIAGGFSRDKKIKFSGELYAIYTLKKHQKKNVGYMLTKKLSSELKRNGIKNMYTCVLKDNPYKSFYIKHGGKLFKTVVVKIGKRRFREEYYGFENLNSFL